MNAPDTSHWRALFQQALDEANGNKTIVADQLGVSRTTVSLVAADKYHGRLDKFAVIVVETFGDVAHCPHLDRRIRRTECRSIALGPVPTSSAREARHWRACQSCPNKPSEVTP